VLATHIFQDTNGRYPPGAANDMQPFGNATSPQWGSSWMVYCLPAIEQESIFNRWQFNGNSGYVNANNAALINNVWINAFRCPTSTMPKFASRGGATAQIMVVSYTGVAGSAIINPGPSVYAVGCCNGAGPLASDNGILHAGSQVQSSHVSDGTSHTWMIAEQSRHLLDAQKQPVTAGYTALVGNSGGLYGWIMGAAHANNGGQLNWGDGRHFNCTTVRYKLNQIGFANSASSGTNNDVGTNFPLSSSHPNGVNIALADGSTRFFGNDLSLELIHAMATKDRGETIEP
jgi:prepilin-type processing-associated H-X9-DG protein